MNCEYVKPELAALILRKYTDAAYTLGNSGQSRPRMHALTVTLESPDVTELFESYAEEDTSYDYKDKVKAALAGLDEGKTIDMVLRDLDLYSEYDITVIAATNHQASLDGLERLVAQYNQKFGLNHTVWL